MDAQDKRIAEAYMKAHGAAPKPKKAKPKKKKKDEEVASDGDVE